MVLNFQQDMRPISALLNENSHMWTRAVPGSEDGNKSVTIVSDSKERRKVLAEMLKEDYEPLLIVRPDDMRQIRLIAKDKESTEMLTQLCEDIKEAIY